MRHIWENCIFCSCIFSKSFAMNIGGTCITSVIIRALNNPQGAYLKGLVPGLWYYLEVIELLWFLIEGIMSLGLKSESILWTGMLPFLCSNHLEVESSVLQTMAMNYYHTTGLKATWQSDHGLKPPKL